MKLFRILPVPKQIIHLGICTLISLILCSNLIWGQTTADLSIDTHVSGDVIVCNNQVTFTIYLQNTSSENLSNLVLMPKMPQGMVYVTGTAVGMNEVLPLNNDDPSFTLPDLTAGSSPFSVSFVAKADCRIIDYIKNRTVENPSIINNLTTINYIKGAVSLTIEEPNGSDSYNVLYPVFETFIPEADRNKIPVHYRDPQIRHFQITNSGPVSVSQFKLKIENAAEVVYESLSLTDLAGTTLATLTYESKVGNTYIYNITNFNGDNLFEQNEVIYFKDQAYVEGVNPAAYSHYSAQWGCDGGVCNLNDQGAIATAYIQSPTGSPVIKNFDLNITAPVSGSVNGGFNIENLGSGSNSSILDAQYDIEIIYSHPKEYSVKNYIVNPNGERTLLIPSETYDYSETRTYSYKFHDLFPTVAADPDGTGGLSDVDGDLAYDDLEVGQKFQFETELTLINPYVKETCNKNGFYNSVYAYLRYKNWNGTNLYKQMGINGNGQSKALNYFTISKENFTGPSDLGSEEQGTFVYTLIGGFYSFDINTSNAKSVYKLTLPEGYELIRARNVNGNIVEYPFVKENNYYLIENTSTYLGSVTLEFDVIKHCAGSQLDIETINLENFYYFNRADLQSYIHFGCNSFEVYNHCQACDGLKTNSFSAKRTTLGWKVPADWNVKYTYDQMYGSGKAQNKVDPNTPGLRLNAAYPGDMIQTTIEGSVTEENYHGLHAVIKYDSPVASNLLDFRSGSFILDGVTYNITGNPIITPTGDKTYTIDFDISDVNPIVTSVPNINTGSVFKLVANFKYLPNISLTRGEYFLNNFRGQFTGVNSQQISHYCLGYGTIFYLLVPQIYRSETMSSEYKCSKVAQVMAPFYEWDSNYNIKDFPNEYRPIALLSAFDISLPQGFVFNPGDIYFTCWSRETKLNNVSFSTDNKRLTFTLANNSVIPNEYYNTQSLYGIKATVFTNDEYDPVPPDQGIKIATYNPTFTLTEYAYLDDPAEHTQAQYTQQMSLLVYTSPQIQLGANSVQDGYSKTVSWSVNFCNVNISNNPYIEKPTNSWVAVELRPDDQSIKLGVPTGENGSDLTGKYTFYHNGGDVNNPLGRAILIQLGDVNNNTCKTINIPATYINCQENVTQNIDIYGSWSCTSPIAVTPTTTTITDLADNSLVLLQDVLSLRYKTSDMQCPVYNVGAERVYLSEPMQYEIDYISTNHGFMNSLELTAELPPAVSVIQAQGTNQPYYTYNGVTNYLPTTLNGNKLTVNVSGLLPPNGELPGNTEPTKNTIRLGLSFIPNGGSLFDAGIPIKFKMTGKTNCAEDRVFPDQRKIRLMGLDPDEIAITVTGTPYQGCMAPVNSNIVTITLTNQLSTFTASNKLAISLSDNINFENLLTGLSGSPVSTEYSDGINKLTFTLPDRFLAPQETKTITFSTTVNQNSPNDDAAYVYVTTDMTGQVYNPSNGQTESVLATTGTGEGTISLGNIFPLVEITGFNQNPVCRNTRLRLKADVTGAFTGEQCKYLWQPVNQTRQIALIRPTSDMEVSVRVTAPNGCITEEETYISTVNRGNPLTDVEIKATFDCSVPSGTLAVEHTEGNQYQWIKDGLDIPGAFDPTLDILQSGNYSVNVTNNACSTVSDEIPVNLNSAENNLNITLNHSLIETGYNLRAKVLPWKFGSVYNWTWGDGSAKATLFNIVYHSYSNAGTYQIGVKSSNLFGCSSSNTGASIRVVKSLCASTIPVNPNAAFYLDKKSGRIVFRDPACSNEVDFGCISGQAEQSYLRRAVKASATTYSDQWNYNDDDFEQLGGIPQNANNFDLGKAGKWRPFASYVYNSNLTTNYKNFDAGTFTLETFNYKFDDCNNPSRWVRTNTSDYYNPSGNILQSRDAIGIPSSEKFGYNQSVVYISAQNAEKDDIFFESFENMYNVNDKQYFEDNMVYNTAQVSIDTKNYHSGKQAASLKNGFNGISTRVFYFSQQTIQKGLLISCWVKVKYSGAEDLIKSSMHSKLTDEAGLVLASSPFKIVAHVGDWFLVESMFKNLAGMSEGKTYIPKIYFDTNKEVYIDDIRIQPTDAKTTAYVFEPNTLRILTVFDEQLFGLYHQYDQEGKLIRKQVETVKGKKTVQETFYNTPKVNNSFEE